MDERVCLLGVDLGKTMDYTSFAIIEMEYVPKLSDYYYHLIGLDRIKGVEYPKVVDTIQQAVIRLETPVNRIGRTVRYTGGIALCMDASGLGAPIKDYLNKSGIFKIGGRKMYPVVFTGGESAHYDKLTHNYNISKAKIIGNFLSLMQHKRFNYAPNMKALPLLEQEIATFKYHLTPSGHAGFDAQSGSHDDLISAVCIPLIIGELKYRKGVRK